jgi:hypothetical protein
LYLEALPIFNQGNVSIPNHGLLLRELRGLERRTHRSGRDSVDHGAHGSDDCSNSLAGALYMALHDARKPKMRVGFCPKGIGKIIWQDDKPEPTRIRFIRVDELGNELTPEQSRAIRNTLPRRTMRS